MTKSIESIHACAIECRGMSTDTVAKLIKRLTALGYSVKSQRSLGHTDRLYIHRFMQVIRTGQAITSIKYKVDSINLAEWVAKNNGSLSIIL